MGVSCTREMQPVLKDKRDRRFERKSEDVTAQQQASAMECLSPPHRAMPRVALARRVEESFDEVVLQGIAEERSRNSLREHHHQRQLHTQATDSSDSDQSEQLVSEGAAGFVKLSQPDEFPAAPPSDAEIQTLQNNRLSTLSQRRNDRKRRSSSSPEREVTRAPSTAQMIVSVSL